SEWRERAEWLCGRVSETGSACSMADQLTEEQIAETSPKDFLF
ncbi:STPG4 isoform 1, partial [Pongo abelii]